MDGEGFGHIGPFGEGLAVLDDHRIGPDLETLGIEPGLPGAHVEFPAMPGTAEQFADPRAIVNSRLRRGRACDAGRLIERRAGVRAAVEQRKELAIDVEYNDVASLKREHLVVA